MPKEAIFTMKLESDLREAFMAAEEASHIPASKIEHEMMEAFVPSQRAAWDYGAYLHGKVTEARAQIAAGNFASATDVEARAADRRAKLLAKTVRSGA